MGEPAAAPRRHLPLFVLTLFLVGGCAALRISRYYGGANLHSDGGALVRPVTVRVDADLQPFSRSCVESLLGFDIHGADSQGANPDLRLMPKAFKGWKRL